MHVLISDYKEQMEQDYTMTIAAIREVLPEASFAIEPYDTPKFYDELEKADGLITAFIPVDKSLLSHAKNLRCISQNAVGYSNVEVEEVKKRNIALCHIEEYCTREVAEHAIALMMALNHNLKAYAYDMRKNKNWLYQNAPLQETLDHKCLVIFGYGRIGRVTASLAKGLGMKVAAVDPYVTKEEMEKASVTKMETEEALKNADVIINHMALTSENRYFFAEETFEKMERSPLFINVGRGGCVKEEALLHALDTKRIAAAGLDVLEEENPDLSKCPFLEKENVILTPHSAFYSKNSIEKLHKISGHNLAYYLAGEADQVEGLLLP